jgi:hypothetical protein
MTLRSPISIMSTRAVLICSLLIALSLGCSSNSTGPEITADEQRYQAFRLLLEQAFSTSDLQLERAYASYTDVDTSIVPGIDWPVSVPELALYFVSHDGGIYAVHARREDDTLKLMSTVHMAFLDHLYQYSLSYSYEELNQPQRQLWSAAAAFDMDGMDSDTVGFRLEYAATRRQQGSCSLNYCDEYRIILDARFAHPSSGDPISILPGAILTGSFDETGSSSVFGSGVTISWDVLGTFLTDNRVVTEVTSGTFVKHDTIDFTSNTLIF